MYYLQESKQDQLFMVIQSGDVTDLQIVLESQLDVNSTNNHGNTGLHLAVWLNKADMVEELINQGAATDLTNNNNQTALHIAADLGFTDIVHLLLDNHCPINAKTKFTEMTALHLASKSGHTAVVELLLDNRADCLATDRINKTAEFYAANEEIRQMLMKQTALSQLLAPKAVPKLLNNTAPSSNDDYTVPPDIQGQPITVEDATAQKHTPANLELNSETLGSPNIKEQKKTNSDEGLQTYTPIPVQKRQGIQKRQTYTTGKLSRELNTQPNIKNPKSGSMTSLNNSTSVRKPTKVDIHPSTKQVDNSLSNATHFTKATARITTMQTTKATAKTTINIHAKPTPVINTRKQSAATKESTKIKPIPVLKNKPLTDKLVHARLGKEPAPEATNNPKRTETSTNTNALETNSESSPLHQRIQAPIELKLLTTDINTIGTVDTTPSQTLPIPPAPVVVTITNSINGGSMNVPKSKTIPQTSNSTTVTNTTHGISNKLSKPKTHSLTSNIKTAATDSNGTPQTESKPITKRLTSDTTRVTAIHDTPDMSKSQPEVKAAELTASSDGQGKMHSNVFDRLASKKTTSLHSNVNDRLAPNETTLPTHIHVSDRLALQKGKLPSNTSASKQLVNKNMTPSLRTNVFDRLATHKATSQTVDIKTKGRKTVKSVKKRSVKQQDTNKVMEELLECVTSND